VSSTIIGSCDWTGICGGLPISQRRGPAMGFCHEATCSSAQAPVERFSNVPLSGALATRGIGAASLQSCFGYGAHRDIISLGRARMTWVARSTLKR
jgi:hypothetical protein